MTEEATPPPAKDDETPITEDDVIAYLSAAGFKSACPICQTNQWLVYIFQGGATGAITVRPSKGNVVLTAGAAVPVYLMGCETCGFARMHIKKAIDAKIRAKRNE